MIIPNIPFPDEHVLGWLGRIRFFNHYPSIEHVIGEIKKQLCVDGKNGKVLPVDTPQLILFANFVEMNSYEFAMKHSMVSYARAFDFDNFGASIWNKKAVHFVRLHGMRAGKKGAWFCPVCVEEDIKYCGVPFWRRKHQIPAVDWCLKHGEQLLGFTDESAFENLPPVKISPDVAIVSGGGNFKNLNSVIKRYMQIAIWLLERERPIDFRLVRWMLAHKANESGLFDNATARFSVEKLIDCLNPDHWMSFFVSKIGNFELNSVLRKQTSQRSTSLYAIALAVLYESTEEALHCLNSVERIGCPPDFNGERCHQEFWQGDSATNAYIRHQGKHKDFANEFSLDRYQSSRFLDAHGLPDLEGQSADVILAVKKFLEGDSLAEAAAEFGVEDRSLEVFLRVASARFARSLQEIDGMMKM